MNTPALLVAAALAYYYRTQLLSALGLNTASTPAAGITAAQAAAAQAAAAGATPDQQAAAAAAAANATPPTLVSPAISPQDAAAAQQITAALSSGDLSPAKLISYAKTQGGAPDVLQLLYNVSQWNYFTTAMLGIPGQTLGDDGSAITAGAYVSLLSTWARNHTA